MKVSTHRYILPLVLLGIHALLLLPLGLPPPGVLRCGGIHAGYSVPLGVLGYAVVYASKQLAGKVPLPKDPRRKRLAQWIELAVLFSMGIVEEVWRWGLVRILVSSEGGEGGYRGTACLGWAWVGDSTGPGDPRPSIWKVVYFMGWVWSLVECTFSWWALRPILNTRHHHHHHHHQDRNSPSPRRVLFPRISQNIVTSRRPLLGKRIRSDSILGPSEDSAENRGLFSSFYRKRRGVQAPPARGEDRAAQFADPSLLAAAAGESESSRTAYDDSIRPENSTASPQKPVDVHAALATQLADADASEESDREMDEASDNDYGDDEESMESAYSSDRSSLDSTRYQSQTPLLSSSQPYDPEQQHPHHESQALLQNAQSILSYNTLTNSAPAKAQPGHQIAHAHEFDSDSDERQQRRSPSGRIYPYAYNRPNPNPATAIAGPSSSTATITPTRPSPPPPRPTPVAQPRARRKVYGVSINSLSPYLPVMWRAAALLRHISNGLLYAWAPTLVYRGKFQWLSFLVLVLLAGKRGWYTVEWFGGGASRVGLTKSSLMTLALAVLIYLVSLAVWGIIS